VAAEEVTVPLDDLKAILDIATQSMDWSSGFLDHDEVATLRRIAVAAGVDPMEATPTEWRLQYSHDFKRQDKPVWWDTPRSRGDRGEWSTSTQYAQCQWCSAPDTDKVHHGDNHMSPLGRGLA
jgi:hypothetical protein